MNNTALIILAAGNSSRFGRSKQLLRFNNKTLLQHAIDEAVAAGAAAIIVVTGANADEVSKDIMQKQVQIVLNQRWQEGMASSIVAGVQAAIASTRIEKIIIAVSDQPFVSTSLFRQLYQAQEESLKPIVASAYSGTIGTPALFAKKYFDALLSLQGEEGAKKILKANKHDIASVDFPQGHIDIDTQKDFEQLLDKQKHIL